MLENYLEAFIIVSLLNIRFTRLKSNSLFSKISSPRLVIIKTFGQVDLSKVNS